MGFIDRIDDALTTARGRHAARREASQAARSIQLHRTYWKVQTFKTLFGDRQLAVPIIFTRRCPTTGVPMCGAVSADGEWLRNGPLTERPPRGVMTLQEYEREGIELDDQTRKQHEKQMRALERQLARLLDDPATARKLIRA